MSFDLESDEKNSDSKHFVHNTLTLLDTLQKLNRLHYTIIPLLLLADITVFVLLISNSQSIGYNILEFPIETFGLIFVAFILLIGLTSMCLFRKHFAMIVIIQNLNTFFIGLFFGLICAFYLHYIIFLKAKNII